MKNIVKIAEVDVPIVEYKGERVVTFKMIDELHQRAADTAGRTFRRNKQRFVEGKHFYHIDFTQSGELRRFEINVPPRGLTLLTERGYLMLVKSFTDDRAWQVQERLIDGYFRTKQMSSIDMIIQSAMELKRLEEKQAEHDNRISLLEAKADRNSGYSGFFSIRSYCRLHNIRIGVKEAATRGKRAKKLSADLGIKTGGVPDELYGRVNVYHEDVLTEVFSDLLSGKLLKTG